MEKDFKFQDFPVCMSSGVVRSHKHSTEFIVYSPTIWCW